MNKVYSKKHLNQIEIQDFLKSYDAKTWTISPGGFIDP